MTLRLAALAAVTLLAGCGSLAQNSDAPTGIYVGIQRDVIADTATVSIVQTVPPAGAKTVPVEGTSCKNKIWQPAPTNENATALMKRQAAAAGMNRVAQVSVEPVTGAVFLNCWSAITARGVAYRGAL